MSTRGYFSNGLNIDAAALLAVGAGKIATVRAEHIGGALLVTPLNVQVPFMSGGVEVNPANDAVTLQAVSAEADTSTLLLRGLDADFREQEALVQLTGTTPVAVPLTWTRLNFVTVTGTEPVTGLVTVSGGGFTFATVDTEAQASFEGLYTGPAGCGLQAIDLIGSMRKSTGSDTGLTITAKVRPIIKEGDAWVSQVPILVFAFGLQRQGATTLNFLNLVPIQFDGPVDIWFTASADASGTTAAVRMSVIIEDLV